MVGSERNWKVAFENSNPICHKLFLISNTVSRVSCTLNNPHLIKFSIRLVRMVPDEICKTEITVHPIELLDWAYQGIGVKHLGLGGSHTPPGTNVPPP